MWGKTEQLNRDRTAVVDEAYFRESLQEPFSKVVAGYPNVMSRYFLNEAQIGALIEYIKQLSPQTAGATLQ
jgi:cytochrome c oxidase subunit 2